MPRMSKKKAQEMRALQRESAASVLRYIKKGECKNALAALLHAERLEAHGVTTIEHLNARDAFKRSPCLRQTKW